MRRSSKVYEARQWSSYEHGRGQVHRWYSVLGGGAGGGEGPGGNGGEGSDGDQKGKRKAETMSVVLIPKRVLRSHILGAGP